MMVKVILKCVIRFSIHFLWYAFRKFCMQILAYLHTVYTSAQKLARPLCSSENLGEWA